MFCPICGCRIESDFESCPECGYRFITEPSEENVDGNSKDLDEQSQQLLHMRKTILPGSSDPYQRSYDFDKDVNPCYMPGPSKEYDFDKHIDANKAPKKSLRLIIAAAIIVIVAIIIVVVLQ